MTPGGESKMELAGKRCPICGKAAAPEHRPFCSRRCADIDLARWLGGGYVIAAGSADADEDGDEDAARSADARPPRDAPESDD